MCSLALSSCAILGRCSQRYAKRLRPVCHATAFSSYLFLIQAFLHLLRYWCTYGPHDNRSKKSQVQSKVSVSPDGQERKRRRSACARGEDSARGCLCHFNVKIMYLWPDITQIHYVHRSHTDISGCICHGTLDPSAIGSRAQFAPKLSTDMRRWVLHQLYKNVSPKQILQEHKLVIQERQSKNKDHVPVRDDFLNKHDVLNISKRLAEDTFQHDVSEAEGVQTWIQRHPELVLFYQEENSSSNLSFILAIQTPWQEEKMITLGHQNVVACDATYGTDKFAVSDFYITDFSVICRRIGLFSHLLPPLSANCQLLQYCFVVYAVLVLHTFGVWCPSACNPCSVDNDFKLEGCGHRDLVAVSKGEDEWETCGVETELFCHRWTYLRREFNKVVACTAVFNCP